MYIFISKINLSCYYSSTLEYFKCFLSINYQQSIDSMNDLWTWNIYMIWYIIALYSKKFKKCRADYKII